MIKQIILLLVLGGVIINPTTATDLASALRAGKVCERPDGFIQTTPGNEDVSNLVTEVNTKRASVYSDIAAREGIDPAAVAQEMARGQKAENPTKFCR